MITDQQTDEMKKRNVWRSYWERRSANAKKLDATTEQQLMRGRRQTYPAPVRKFSFDVQPSSQSLQITLDVGCGLGATIGWRHGGAETVVGIDFSFNMLKLTQRKFRQEGVENVRLVVADATALPFADTVFDRLTCMGVLQMIDPQDTVNVFKESYRVAKNDASIIFTIRNSLSLYAITRSIALRLAPLVGKARKRYLHYHSYRWYRQQLIDLGGKILTEHSSGLEPFLAPPSLIRLIRVLEIVIAKRTTILRPFGVTYFFEVQRRISSYVDRSNNKMKSHLAVEKTQDHPKNPHYSSPRPHRLDAVGGGVERT